MKSLQFIALSPSKLHKNKDRQSRSSSTIIHIPFTMRCFSLFSTETQYHHPSERSHTRSKLSSRLQRMFKGPPERRRQPQYRDEKKYHHKPSHSASSFIKTTTTPGMIEADPTLMFEAPLEQRIASHVEATPEHTLPRESLI